MFKIAEQITQNYQEAPRKTENIFGQKAVIRLFDPDDQEDLTRLKAITTGPEAQKWLIETEGMTDWDFFKWASEQGERSKKGDYLFSVGKRADLTIEDEIGETGGFVYVYGEKKEQRDNTRELVEKGIVPSEVIKRGNRIFEISMGVLPSQSNQQEGSGIMASGLRQVCLEVEQRSRKTRLLERLRRGFKGKDETEKEGYIQKIQDRWAKKQPKVETAEQMLLNETPELPEAPNIYFIAYCEPANESAQKTLEAAGFVYQGDCPYEAEDDEPAGTEKVYLLDWHLLQQKIHQQADQQLLRGL